MTNKLSDETARELIDYLEAAASDGENPYAWDCRGEDILEARKILRKAKAELEAGND